VAAASVEQAKELARALVTIYNVGYVRFERQELLKALEEAKEKLAKLAPELEKAQDQAKRDQEATNALPDIPEQTINDLKTRRWLLDVDLAGVRARVEAAQKLSAELKGDAAKTARYEQTEVIKTTAQIDLADLLARQERVTVILADAVKRAEAAHRLRTSAGRVDGFKAEMDQVKDYARAMQDPFESPVLKPLEVIGKITIQPITWPVQESKPGEGLRP
jgi:chromosome segregation ATPase